MAEPLVLGVDQGTSATKAVIFGPAGEMRAHASAELASSYPRPGFVEQSPRDILRSVMDAVRRCCGALKESGGDPADVAACGISNQRETFVLWDRAGNPLGPAVVWQCRRSVEICERLRSEGIEEELRRRTGLRIDPYFSATKLLWLLDNDPAVGAAVRSGDAWFGTVDSWLLFRLTGGAVHAMDHTNASRTLLFNLETMDWDPWILDRWGLGALRLPTVKPSAFVYAAADFDGVLPHRVPVAAMIGDSHAAAFGEGCVSPGMAKATMGTGSSILMNVGPARVDSKSGMVSTVCWSIPGRLDHALEGIIVSAGATVKWLKDQLGLFAASADTEALAASVPDNGGVHIVPGFSGMGAPWWRMDARAAICGLTLASTREHVVRAALESIPFQIADIISSMAADSPVPLSELRVDGGITTNAFVMQLLADVLGRPVVNPGLQEVSALGAALLAGLGSGMYRGIAQAAATGRTETRYSPGPESRRAREDHAAWRNTVAKVL